MINRKFGFSESLQNSEGKGAGENARYLAVWGLRCTGLDSCAVELFWSVLAANFAAIFGYLWLFCQYTTVFAAK